MPNSNIASFTIQGEVLLNKCGPENLWGLNQHFPHILSTFSPHFHNKLPIPTNCQLIINHLSMFSPQIPYYSTMYQLSPHFKINILYLVPTSCQCTSSLWGECGDMLMWGKPGGNVETDLLLILLPYHSSIVGRVWGLC